MRFASSSPTFTYHVSMEGDLRAACSPSGVARHGAHCILSGLIPAQDPQLG